METLNYSKLDEKIKLKFYKHIEDKFVKKYKEMGLTPFEELSKRHRDNDIEYEINKKFYLMIYHSLMIKNIVNEQYIIH